MFLFSSLFSCNLKLIFIFIFSSLIFFYFQILFSYFKLVQCEFRISFQVFSLAYALFGRRLPITGLSVDTETAVLGCYYSLLTFKKQS